MRSPPGASPLPLARAQCSSDRPGCSSRRSRARPPASLPRGPMWRVPRRPRRRCQPSRRPGSRTRTVAVCRLAVRASSQTRLCSSASAPRPRPRARACRLQSYLAALPSCRPPPRRPIEWAAAPRPFQWCHRPPHPTSTRHRGKSTRASSRPRRWDCREHWHDSALQSAPPNAPGQMHIAASPLAGRAARRG
eukprot:4838283-Prymnesium_polylepis.1